MSSNPREYMREYMREYRRGKRRTNVVKTPAPSSRGLVEAIKQVLRSAERLRAVGVRCR